MDKREILYIALIVVLSAFHIKSCNEDPEKPSFNEAKYKHKMDSLEKLKNAWMLKFYKSENEQIKWRLKVDSAKTKIVYIKQKRDDQIHRIDSLTDDELFDFFSRIDTKEIR